MHHGSANTSYHIVRTPYVQQFIGSNTAFLREWYLKIGCGRSGKSVKHAIVKINYFPIK